MNKLINKKYDNTKEYSKFIEKLKNRKYISNYLNK